MPTRAELERLADQAAADAARARRLMEEALEQERVLRKLAETAASTETSLHIGQNKSSLDSKKMNTDHKLAISRGRASSRTDAEFKAAYRSKNLTLTMLAMKVGVDAALLSKYRRKLRRIPQDRAEAIAKLIPWPADAKHWPGGIVPKD